MLPALRSFEVKFRVEDREKCVLCPVNDPELLQRQTPLGLNKTATAVMKATICQSKTVVISR
jgi:hypothetical protein